MTEVANQPRWRLVNDDDGHWYIIPAHTWDEFGEWLEWEADYYSVNGDDCPEDFWRGTDFESYGLGGSPHTYTFVDPREDK